MSEENVEILRRGFEAFARGDIDAVLDVVGPDPEWAPGILPVMGGNAIRGKNALRRFFVQELWEAFDEFRAEPLSFEDLGDSVLAPTRYVARGERSGLEIEQTFFSVYTFREGKIVWFRDFETRSDALAAAGLSE
jgi:ketosteroid isomerase-like protein